MNYPRIYERLYCQPVAITPSRFHALHAAVLPRLTGRVDSSLEEIVAESIGNDPVRPSRSAVGDRGRRVQSCFPDSNGILFAEAKPGVAVVPVYGVLAKNLSSFEESCGGGSSIEAISRAFDQAIAAAGIEAVILDAGDSPGGEVVGIPEFAEQVRAGARVKPVYGFTDKGCFSAAYWSLSGASEFYATPSSRVGSIGVRAGWLDETIALELAGLQLHVFEGGRHKGAGLPGRGMSDEEKAMLQAEVDHYFSIFQADVRAGRGSVASDTMQGQIHLASRALELNLIDGLFSSWSEFVEAI